MKTSTILKFFTAIVTTALFVGAAAAGPSNPTALATSDHRSVGCPSQEAVTKNLGIVIAKANTPVRAIVGTKFVGCAGTTVATMTCKGSIISCSEMIRG
jgi:hypothetical protein